MNKEITVFKFGGSVLRDENDLPKAVNEIYRNWRNGVKILVVVSAFNGRTDELLAKAKLFDSDDGVATASLLLSGETESAALLTLALGRAGLPAKILTPRQIGLLTRGETLDAEPIWADTTKLRGELENSIVVVSGFGGIDRNGDPTLLGRGGSDLTALFLAERLDARCILVKDVGGLYESDPAFSHEPRRFATAFYRTAAEIGGCLIQKKAVEFAEENSLTVELRSLNTETGTVISNLPNSFANRKTECRRLRVALLGCGTVGSGVFEAISNYPEKFEIVGVLNRHRDRAIAAGIPPHLIANDAEILLAKNTDVVIELIGGTDTAHDLIKRSLSDHRHVITANKALLAEKVIELSGAAKDKGVLLRFGASVGGALPAFEFAADDAGQITSISGILNGTCNFICDKLAEGIEFNEAVKLAQSSGFAEADPTLDIDGTDAAQKLGLLARSAFGVEIPFDAIKRKGIENLTPKDLKKAASHSHTIRLIAKIERNKTGFEASVEPREISFDHAFGSIDGAGNCLLIEEQDGRKRFVTAKGAGRYPTTESVMADLFDLYRLHQNTPVKKLTKTAEAGI
jgi:homoserine dehydrogenase